MKLIFMKPFFSSLSVSSFALLALGAISTAHAETSRPHFSLTPADTTVAAAPTTVLVTGRVEGLKGLLPGSVVSVRVNQKAVTTVTNANGEFTLPLPAAGGPWPTTVSYAGYADVATTLAPEVVAPVFKLTTPRVVKVSRKYQMKTYRRTAQRQIRRTLRRV